MSTYTFGEFFKKKMVMGGFLGGVIGLATTLLFAPKRCIDFIKGFYKPIVHRTTQKHLATSKKSHSQTKSSLQHVKTTRATPHRKSAQKTLVKTPTLKKSSSAAVHKRKGPRVLKKTSISS